MKNEILGVAILCIILYIVDLFLIYYVQQTRHRTIAVFDSVGPLVRSSHVLLAALSDTSWSDWFHLAQPTDRFGFIAAWWRERGKSWDTLLAFLKADGENDVAMGLYVGVCSRG